MSSEVALDGRLPKFNDTSYAHFITTRTYRNRPHFKDDVFARIVLDELIFYSEKCGFILLGYVIMPDHVHLLSWWDKGERPGVNVSKIMQGIKGSAARRIVDLARDMGLERMLQPTPGRSGRRLGQELGPYRRNLGYRVWQPGFYDFNVFSEQKLLEKLDYMHGNPVKAGLAQSPCDYEWSSYREYHGDKVATRLGNPGGEACRM